MGRRARRATMEIEQTNDRKQRQKNPSRPHRITLWLRKVGLEKDVTTVIVSDREIGRWKQWKKIVSGECAACFIAPIYLAEALAAGLKTFPASEAEVVSLFAQACLSEFAAENSLLLKDYLKAVIHAVALFKYRRDEVMAIAAQEPMRLMKLTGTAKPTPALEPDGE